MKVKHSNNYPEAKLETTTDLNESFIHWRAQYFFFLIEVCELLPSIVEFWFYFIWQHIEQE